MSYLLANSNRALTGACLHDQADFSRFYDHYAPLLYGQLLRQTTPLVRAQDVLEATFIQCWRRREEVNQLPPGAPLSWLLRIAHETSESLKQT